MNIPVNAEITRASCSEPLVFVFLLESNHWRDR